MQGITYNPNDCYLYVIATVGVIYQVDPELARFRTGRWGLTPRAPAG